MSVTAVSGQKGLVSGPHQIKEGSASQAKMKISCERTKKSLSLANFGQQKRTQLPNHPWSQPKLFKKPKTASQLPLKKTKKSAMTTVNLMDFQIQDRLIAQQLQFLTRLKANKERKLREAQKVLDQAARDEQNELRKMYRQRNSTVKKSYSVRSKDLEEVFQHNLSEMKERYNQIRRIRDICFEPRVKFSEYSGNKNPHIQWKKQLDKLNKVLKGQIALKKEILYSIECRNTEEIEAKMMR